LWNIKNLSDAAHEFGHLLGVGHTDDVGNLMNKFPEFEPHPARATPYDLYRGVQEATERVNNAYSGSSSPRCFCATIPVGVNWLNLFKPWWK
jgi:hypothetical protein